MSTAEVVAQLRRMSNAERLAVIEAATQLVREELRETISDDTKPRDERLRAAALAVRDLYEPGGEHTEWTALDAEDVLDDSLPR